jgi:hypothetical protein
MIRSAPRLPLSCLTRGGGRSRGAPSFVRERGLGGEGRLPVVGMGGEVFSCG